MQEISHFVAPLWAAHRHLQVHIGADRMKNRFGHMSREYGEAMAMLVNAGTTIQCSFGVAPTPLSVLPLKRTMAVGPPAATIMDNKPMMNVIPFGVCSSIANPMVAAATAAAMGVLTPMPCLPVIPAPWVPGSPTVLIGGVPALSSTSKCMCAYGGVIQVVVPGQVTVQTP